MLLVRKYLASLLLKTAYVSKLPGLEELALTNQHPLKIVLVIGKLVIDVRDPKNSVGFVNLIKNFRLSSKLITKARKLGPVPVKVVSGVDQLVKELHSPRWREWPMVLNVPAATQIFGRIVLDALN